MTSPENAVANPSASRHALAFIFITMLVDTIGLGIIIPVTPKLIVELTGGGMSEAARWGGWLFFVYALMQFLCAPAIGGLSDRFGRRPVLILALAMLGVDYLITAMAPTIFWLFIGRFLSGVAGAAYPTANAYIADVSPPEKRAANFGLVGAAFGVGFVIGPAIGGLLGQYGARLPFYVSAGIAFANALYGFIVLKESLPRESRRKFELWRANPLGALVALRRFPAMLGLFGVTVLMRLAHDANPVLWTFYTMLKFHWSPRSSRIFLDGDRCHVGAGVQFCSADCGAALGRDSLRLYRSRLRGDRIHGIRFCHPRLDALRVDGGICLYRAERAGHQRDHVAASRSYRAG